MLVQKKGVKLYKFKNLAAEKRCYAIEVQEKKGVMLYRCRKIVLKTVSLNQILGENSC